MVAVIVAEIHGEDVVRHVGNAVPDDKVGGEPVPEKEKYVYKHSNEAVVESINEQQRRELNMKPQSRKNFTTFVVLVRRERLEGP